MKALVFSDVAKSSIREVKTPKAGKSELIVKVKACAICGTDIKLNEGSSTKLTKHGIKEMSFPRITGHEFAGVVKEVGENVRDFKKGDRINVSPVIPCMECNFCKINHHEICDNKIIIGFDIDGGFAEYIKIPDIAIKSGCIHRIADDVSFEKATFTEPLAVVLNSHERSTVKPGDSVLILGAGPIGLLQLMVSKHFGAKKIMIADISQDRLDFAERLNPNIIINNSKDDLTEIVLQKTRGNGADVVFICASAKKLFEDCLRFTNKLGRINFFTGLPKSDAIIKVNANIVHYNQITLTGTSDSTPDQNRKAMELINKHKIDVKSLISHRLYLKDYFKGLEIAKTGKSVKVIIDCEL